MCGTQFLIIGGFFGNVGYNLSGDVGVRFTAFPLAHSVQFLPWVSSRRLLLLLVLLMAFLNSPSSSRCLNTLDVSFTHTGDINVLLCGLTCTECCVGSHPGRPLQTMSIGSNGPERSAARPTILQSPQSPCSECPVCHGDCVWNSLICFFTFYWTDLYLMLSRIPPRQPSVYKVYWL